MDQYFAERIILASRNDNVDSINKNILRQFPGEFQTFLSADSIKNNGEGGQEVLKYPVEYLNSINCSRLPLHKLELKKDSPVIVLREIRLITGHHAGSTVFIPRMGITPAETQIPFEFWRRQFSIRLCFAIVINKSQGQLVALVWISGIPVLHMVNFTYSYNKKHSLSRSNYRLVAFIVFWIFKYFTWFI